MLVRDMATDRFGDARERGIHVRRAQHILQSRLVDTVREKIGITYSPQVSSLA